MPERTSDEDWAAGLQALAREVPAVPVDVAGAVRRGRRRRAARSVALGGGTLAVVVGVVVVAGPSLLGGLGPVSGSSADSAASVADGAATAGGSSVRVVSVEELAADVAAVVPAPALDQPFSGYDSSSTERLVVEQHGEPDPSSYRSALDAATGTVPGVALESSARPLPGGWPTATVACLQGAGWDVVATDDGWSAQVPTSSPVQFLADVNTCTPAA